MKKLSSRLLSLILATLMILSAFCGVTVTAGAEESFAVESISANGKITTVEFAIRRVEAIVAGEVIGIERSEGGATLLSVASDGTLYSVDGRALLNKSGNAYNVLNKEMNAVVVYDDVNGYVRYYVNGNIAYLGDGIEAIVAVSTSGTEIGIRFNNDIVADGYTCKSEAVDEIFNYVGLQEHGDNNQIRILSGINTVWYESVGYEIEVYDATLDVKSEIATIEGTRVYESVHAAGEYVSATAYGYNFFAPLVVEEITQASVGSTVIVTPFAKAGSLVYEGKTTKITVTADGYDVVENYDPTASNCAEHYVGTPLYDDSKVSVTCENCGEIIWTTSGVAVEKIVDTNGGSGFTGERPYDANDKPKYMVSRDVVSKANKGGYAIYFKYKLGDITNPDSEVSVLSLVAKRGSEYNFPVFLRQAVIDGELVMKIANAEDAPYFKLTSNTEYDIIIVVDPSNDKGWTEHVVYVNGVKVGAVEQAQKVYADADSVYFRINDQYKNKTKTFIEHFEVMTVDADGFVIPEATVFDSSACDAHTEGTPVYSNSVVTNICNKCGEPIWRSVGVAIEKWVDTNDGKGFNGERTVDTNVELTSELNKGGYAIVLNYEVGELANPDSEVSVLSVVSKRGADYGIPVFLRQAVVDGKLVMKIANSTNAPYFELESKAKYNIIIVVDPVTKTHTVYVDGVNVGTVTQASKVFTDAESVYFRINDQYKNKTKTFINHFEVVYLNERTDVPEIVVPEVVIPNCEGHTLKTLTYKDSTLTMYCENCKAEVVVASKVAVEKQDIDNGDSFVGEKTIVTDANVVSTLNENGYVVRFNYTVDSVVADGEVSVLSVVGYGADKTLYIPIFLRQYPDGDGVTLRIQKGNANAPGVKLFAGQTYEIMVFVDVEDDVTTHSVYVDGKYLGSSSFEPENDHRVVESDVAEGVHFRINDQYKNKSRVHVTDFEVLYTKYDFVIGDEAYVDGAASYTCDGHTLSAPTYADSAITMHCEACGKEVYIASVPASEKWTDTNDGNGFNGERQIATSASVVSKLNSDGYVIRFNYKLGEITAPEADVAVLTLVSTKGNATYTTPCFIRQYPDGNGGVVFRIAKDENAPAFTLTADTEHDIMIFVNATNSIGMMEYFVFVDGEFVGSYEQSNEVVTDGDNYYFRINDGYKNKCKTYINHFEVLYLNGDFTVRVAENGESCKGHNVSTPVYSNSRIIMYCMDCDKEIIVTGGVGVEKQDIDNGDSFIGEKQIYTDANVVSTLNENGYVVRFNYTLDSIVASEQVSVLSVVGKSGETWYIPIYLRQYPDGDGITLRIEKGNADAPGVQLFAGQTYEIMVFVDVEEDATTHSVYVDGKYIGSSSVVPANDVRVIPAEAEGLYFRINDQYKNKSRVHVTDFEVLYTRYDFVIGDEAYVDKAITYGCDGHSLTAPVYEDSTIKMFCEDCGEDVYVASVPASEKWTDNTTNGGVGFNGERQIATSASVVSKLNSDGYVIRFGYKLGEIAASEADVALLTLVSTKGGATYTTPCFIRQYPDGNGGVVFRIAKDENAPAFTLTADTEHDIMIFVNATNSIGMMEYFVFVDGAFVGSYEQLNEVVTDGDNYYFRINDQWKNKTKIYIKDFEVLYLNGEFDVKNEAVESCEGHNISAPTYLSSKITAYCYDCQKNIVITGGVGVSNWSDYTDNSGKGFTGERKIDVPTDLVATDDGLGYAIRFKYNLTSIDLPTDQDEVSVFSIVTKNADGGWVIPVFLRQFSIGGELYLKTKGTTSAPGFKLEANKEYDILILVDPTNDAGAYVTAVYVNGEYLGSTAYSGSEIITSDMTGCYIRINDSYRNKCYTQIKDLTVLYMNADYNVLEGGDPWEVATDAVNTWLERWEVIKQGGDKNADTLDYGNHYEKIDNYNFATNSYYEYRELSWVRKADGSYTRNISRLVSTLKNYTYNNNETNYYDVYGGYTANGQIAEATGYFYTTKIGDRWWTVDPLGYPFFRTAMNEVTGGVSPTQKDNVITKHGTLAAWAESATEKLQALGFNSMGAWSDVANLTAVENSNPLTETRIIGVLSKYASSVGINTTSGGSTTLEGSIMPVFDPAFETLADWYVYQGTYGQKYNPNVYGWMSDNELPDDDDMLDAILLLENPMNTAYAYTYATAITFLKAKGIENPTVDDLTPEIRREFKAMTYDKYFEVVVAALDKYVPNHQYIGCRLLPENWKQEEFIRVYGYWCDVLSINYYGSWTPQPEMTHNWLLWAGKPFISTEWYAMAREDSGLESTSGAGFTVQTQQDRAEFYQNYALALLEFKGCVGFDWFKMWDNDPTDEAGIANDSSNANGNKGIYSTEYNEWTTLTEAMAKVNNNKYSLIAFFDARD